MKLCNSQRIHHLLECGELRIDAGHRTFCLLDDFRVGLRVRDEVQLIVGPVDLMTPKATPTTRRSLAAEGMQPHEWVLGFSLERFSVSSRLFGFVNTRSKYARLGLEMVGSSWLVAPGFGQTEPTSIVFEMTARNRMVNFSEDLPFAYMMLFELDQPVLLDGRTYNDRFPFDQNELG
jgi:deoxycytidine triphosphate deaminase